MMWESADYFEVSVRRNTVTPVGFEIWDCISDLPVDLTGYTVFCNIAAADGNFLFKKINAVDLELSVGYFGINFNGNDFSDILGKKEEVYLSLQVIAENFSGPVTICGGKIKLIPGV